MGLIKTAFKVPFDNFKAYLQVYFVLKVAFMEKAFINNRHGELLVSKKNYPVVQPLRCKDVILTRLMNGSYTYHIFIRT